MFQPKIPEEIELKLELLGIKSMWSTARKAWILEKLNPHTKRIDYFQTMPSNGEYEFEADRLAVWNATLAYIADVGAQVIEQVDKPLARADMAAIQDAEMMRWTKFKPTGEKHDPDVARHE